MSRVRSLVLKASAAVVVLAALAACDAPTGALGPRSIRAPGSTRNAVTDSLGVPLPGIKVNTMSTTDEETCRSGYHIAYRDDGTFYCEADPVDTPPAF
jgi:hypothetical protein